MKKRPSLQLLMTPTPPTERPIQNTQAATRSRGRIQLNVLVPQTLRIEAKIKAMREGRDLSDVIEGLLTDWIANPVSPQWEKSS